MGTIELRDYQQALIDRIRREYAAGKRRVLLVLPTGGGKTFTFSYIANNAAQKNNKVLILVHRRELLQQASKSLKMLGVEHGLILPGKKTADLSKDVYVTSVQTLARRLHKYSEDSFQLIIVDEAHHTNARTWADILQHFQDAKLLGVTATPCRQDGAGLKDFYDAMVVGPSIQTLVENKHLAKARTFAPPGFSDKRLKIRMGDFAMQDAQARVELGDVIEHYNRHLAGKTAIAFCCSIEHSKIVAQLFEDAGIASRAISGEDSYEYREETLGMLETGEIKVVTNCSLIGEGVDVPSVGGCILLRPTTSLSLHLQMIGRCLRPSSGKEYAVILDHVGNTIRNGSHLEDFEWCLQEGVKKRKNDAPSVKTCPECFAAMGARVTHCEECGFEFEEPEPKVLRKVNGKLVEVTEEELEKIRRTERSEVARARTYDELLKIQYARGYKHGWARMVLRARTRGHE